jgi:uncharacterized protein YcbX
MVTSGFDSAAGRLSFAFPDGTKLEGASDAGEEPIRTDFFGRFVDGHHMPDFWNERLSAYLGMPVRLVRCDEAGAASDVYPVTLMSSASVEELGRRAGEADATNPDGRRFRMLIEVDGCEPHEEDTWDGSRVRVGAATLAMKGQVPRCAATNLSPATGEKDFNTLKILNAYRAGGEITMPFGVYAEVETPGVVTVGDVLEFAAASEAPHAAAQST